jgi:hypothetical protein
VRIVDGGSALLMVNITMYVDTFLSASITCGLLLHAVNVLLMIINITFLNVYIMLLILFIYILNDIIITQLIIDLNVMCVKYHMYLNDYLFSGSINLDLFNNFYFTYVNFATNCLYILTHKSQLYGLLSKRCLTLDSKEPKNYVVLNDRNPTYFTQEDLITTGLFRRVKDKPVPEIDTKDVRFSMYRLMAKELQFTMEINDPRFYIMYKYDAEHQDHKIETYEQLISLININRNLLKWYKAAREEFVSITQAPDWLKDSYEDLSHWRADYVKKNIFIKEHMKGYTEERKKIDAQARIDKAAVDDKQSRFVETNVKDLYVVLIDRITVGSLPIEVSQRINAEFHGTDKHELELNKALSAYKKDLLYKYKSGQMGEPELIQLLKEALSSQ